MNVRHDMLAYANLMVRDEWPRMRAGGFDGRADLVVMDAMGAAEDFNPAELRESNAQNATLQQLGLLHDFRQRRLSDNASGVSSFEWLVLVVGASCVISLCCLFGPTNARMLLVMTSAVTVLIASAFVLLFELQYPFRSNLGIETSDWVALVNHIHIMQTGSQMDMRM